MRAIKNFEHRLDFYQSLMKLPTPDSRKFWSQLWDEFSKILELPSGTMATCGFVAVWHFLEL